MRTTMTQNATGAYRDPLRHARPQCDAPRPLSQTRGAGQRFRQRADSINRTRSPLGRAPATDWTGSPPLKTVNVGTDSTR
jgi:hypothetical protein